MDIVKDSYFFGDGFYGKSNSYDLPKNEEYESSEYRRSTSVVELEKKEGTTLGLIISGGIDKNSIPKIANLRPGSIAHRSDALAVGDYIISVNGIRTCKLKHEEIVNLLKNAGNKLVLEIEYEVPISPDCNVSVTCKVIQVKLDKENESFGFTLRGGSCNDRLKTRPLTITHVRFGGPANRAGVIKAGDRLLAVDGINLSTASLQDALQVLKQIKQSALLTIEYDVSIIDAVKNATGPLLIEIDKTPGCLLGISLSCISVPEHAIVIESIRQASVAERCGALHVGDHILAIDDIKVDLMTSAEAMQLLKSSASDIVKFEILPVSQITPRPVPESNKWGLPSPNFIPRVSYNSCYNTLSSLSGLSVNASVPINNAGCSMGMRKPCNGITLGRSLLNSVVHSSSDGSLTSLSKSTCTSVGRADRTEVILSADQKGFGFMLQGHSYTSEALSVPPYINCIDHGSPAERSGVLQIGDRILAVNDESTEGLSLDEVTRVISHSHSQLVLIIEFDVAEAVVPSSGTFTVKLVKRGSDVGITVTAPRNRQLGEPLIIADVRKGSIAHRTGSIQPGDKLLSINSLRTENCTIEDATSVLQSCNDIVKLRIRKDESFSELPIISSVSLIRPLILRHVSTGYKYVNHKKTYDLHICSQYRNGWYDQDPDATCAIVYTVELVRHGGPLGITVSGTEEPFDPIYISSLTENGLAERTGALHVGDRLLAINGNSLRGKTLNEAICILQTCGDKVTLKISKCPCPEKADCEDSGIRCFHCVPETQMKKFSTPLPSIDSAVDSWDSCNPGASNCPNQVKSEFYGHSASDGNISALYQNEPSKSAMDETYAEQNNWEMKTMRSNSFSGSICLPSDEEKESWHKVLEDLQTCGQSQLLRQIEQSILGFDENSNEPKSSDSERNFQTRDVSPTGTLSENNLLELNSQIEQLNINLKERDSDIRGCYLNNSVETKHKELALRHSMCNEPRDIYCFPSSSYSASLPVEIHRVTLFKDQVYEDFGFSLSDGKYENGVFINSIRPGGPADMSGLIKPLDRILQVNGVKTYNAGLIVPLIASSGDRIELVISRPAYNGELSSDSTLARTSHFHPWVEEDKEGSLSPFPSNSQTQTLTKTL